MANSGIHYCSERLHIICQNSDILSKLIDDGIHDIVTADQFDLLSLPIIHRLEL